MSEGKQKCGRCNGSGEISVKKIRVKKNPQTGAEETYIYWDSDTCPACGGSGWLQGRTR